MLMQTLRAALVAGVALMAAPLAAQEISFDLHNETGVALVEFYASPTSADDWEEDILGMDVLAAGESATVTIGGDRGCDYDLLFVFADGDELVDSDNLCEISEYTLGVE